MSENNRVYGVKERTETGSDVERFAESIRIKGYAIIPDVIASGQIEDLRVKLDQIYQQQVDEIGGEANLSILGDNYNVRCPLVYDDAFLTVASDPVILRIVEKLLGDYFILMLQNGILNVPFRGNDQNAGFWHRDLNYQHFVSSRPLSISGLLCVDDFSDETGGTYLLPASHKVEPFPSLSFVEQNQIVVNAKAGSWIVFDSMMFHRGSYNRSNKVRRAINHMFALPFLKQQISLPQALNHRFEKDPFLSKFLGYESEPPQSVRQFRQDRIDRTKR
jgi:ectoine hydroxylase-related dioxygenase (phytanoyl-CoA dioxygenase family)